MRTTKAIVWWVALLSWATAVADPNVRANQGAPGTQGAWLVLVSSASDGGVTLIQEACGTVVETVTVVGTDAGLVPASAQAGRKRITICNSHENTGFPFAKCRGDGTNPVMGVAGPGQVLSKGDCVTYSSETATRCVADTASTTLSATECR